MYNRKVCFMSSASDSFIYIYITFGLNCVSAYTALWDKQTKAHFHCFHICLSAVFHHSCNIHFSFQIKYGGLDDDKISPLPRTRGRKINYQEIAGSESEEVRNNFFWHGCVSVS
jgi:hypothetical protein